METDILVELLKPQDTPWDYVLYVVMALEIILLGVIFAGTLRDVIFIAITVLCSFADKIYLFGFIEGGYAVTSANMARAIDFHTKDAFLTYAARVAMFSLPLLIVTQTKISRAKPAAVITAVFSGVYMFSRWFFQQYPEGEGDFNRRGAFILLQGIYVGQAAIMYLMLGKIKLQDYIDREIRSARNAKQSDTSCS